ncbi:monovalent cation:proton antiporter family protein [Pontibacillus yanchengensis]|uniref:Sodium:proton antiporter n=1 Tax=Pontibacillus yanchengensis Y32 TaxID=1385514 RepID=A0A0A2TIV7_9BACI|nr:monovalent cation:proton antiporter family protein [Pontibacillus yanchengensis]KGP74338.1 sodium:proton antiporter [Pontibacillus yanchengensis Y32]
MEHGSASVTSLVIVILAAFITPILLHRFKLRTVPIVVAEIIVGLIIGKSGFDLIESGMWLETLSTLGFIFLMFLSGLEIDFSAFAGGQKKEKTAEGNFAPNPLKIASSMFVVILLLSLGMSYLFVVFDFIDNVFLMTLIISTISLGVVVPTLKDAGMMKTHIGQIVLLVTVIADLSTMILLAIFVSIYGGEESGSMWLLLILFGAGVLIYFLGKKFRDQSFVQTMSKGTVQIDTRAIFTIIMVLVGISETVGAENILGAFLAGVIVALLSPNQEMVKRLDSFGYGFLIPIFFVMVGVGIDIPKLFQDSKILLLMPLLFLALVVAKMVPSLMLRRWYSWKEVFASGSILTAKLSLVIAAATIGQEMGLITTRMEGALILVSVISCLIAPVIFKKLYNQDEEESEHSYTVSFIGSNRMTLPVVRELDPKLYETHLYHTKVEKVDERISNSCFQINDVESYDVDDLHGQGIFDVDVLVVSTGDEQQNAVIAKYAKDRGVERVIARAETSELNNELKAYGVEVFSVFLSSKALLKAMIVAPNSVDLLTKQESQLYQINMNNPRYDGMYLRNFPFTGDVIMVRIFREKDSIVPHGDTELKMDDRLIVTGSSEYVEELRMDLEFCEIC